MKTSPTTHFLVLTTLLLASGPLMAQTCTQFIFASGFEDIQGPPTSEPADGATNVELESIVSATFVDKIASNSVNKNTFQLSQGGQPVTSTVILDSTNNRAKLGPEKTLALLTEYTATLTGCITDQSGSPLPAVSWSFTTRDGSWEIIEKMLEPGKTAPAIEPRIAVSDDGSAVIVWTENSAGRTDIWAKHYEPGVGWGAPVLVETDTTFSSNDPQVTMDGAGQCDCRVATCRWFRCRQYLDQSL